MLGAIIGDIIGSRFEFHNHLSKDFELFHRDCRFTDDTVMTVAVADWCNQDCKPDVVTILQRWANKYRNAGFSPRFLEWVDDPKPYNSFGNGAAMRVSPLGWMGLSKFELKKKVLQLTNVSHNHKFAIRGANAIAEIIQEINNAKEIGFKYYFMDITSVNTWQLHNRVFGFNPSCPSTVPAAITCFLQAVSFEDAIRNAVSIGGDTDTIASMTGAMAEAYYGVPDEIKERALLYLPKEMKEVYRKFVEKYGKK